MSLTRPDWRDEHFFERRRDMETAVQVELIRIYSGVFGPKATARFNAVSAVSGFVVETVLERESLRGRA